MPESGRKGQLIVVGTPIGNLEDISPRAVRALAEADVIFCEDTRVTAKLAARFGLSAKRVSCPAPRERARTAELLRRLGSGESVALVSDAGMPALSDPGERLVAAASAAGFPVRIVPGPSAPAAALALSGLPAIPHVFVGFLPARAGERTRFLEALRPRAETLVWFEAPHRLAGSLDDAARVLGPRRACVARELTKLHEETLRATLPELARLLRARGPVRGEVTVVVEGNTGTEPPQDAEDPDEEILSRLAAGEGKRALSKEIAARTRRPAREIYARAVALGRRETEDGKRETKPR